MTKYPNYLIIFLLTFINLCLANDTCPLKPNNSQNENENNSNILAIMNILKYLMKNFTYLLFGNFGIKNIQQKRESFYILSTSI
uniref:Uncharacterized protein n=1 Tax=Meloidogyne enterolobii TaxID=390850 RepID=A0A6V7X0M5_MELEN|nr:unnamed protein product [Meloidogyne enterolobii]